MFPLVFGLPLGTCKLSQKQLERIPGPCTGTEYIPRSVYLDPTRSFLYGPKYIFITPPDHPYIPFEELAFSTIYNKMRRG